MNIAPLLKVKDPLDIPGHSMFGDWALPGRPCSYIALSQFAKAHLRGKVPTRVSLADICAKPEKWFGLDDFSGPRFDKADPIYPGFLVRAMPNPCGLPFRMIDGRRRLEKIRRRGDTSSMFLVFEFAEVEPFIFDFVLLQG